VTRLAALIVLACGVLGATVGFAVPMLGDSVYRSSATVVFTAVQLDARPATASEARHITERVPTWAKVASSDVVARKLRPDEHITAHEISGAQSLLLSLNSPNADGLAERATEAANAVIAVITREETPLGAMTSRVAGVVSQRGGEPENISLSWAMWAAVLGGVVGAVLGWLGCALARPGKWVQQVVDGVSRETGAAAFAASVDHEMRALAAAVRSRCGFFVIALCFFAVAGYAATGSVVPPFLVMLVAAIASVRDLRWIAVALLGLGITVLPAKLELVKLGPVTPTVIEIAVLIGLAVVWRKGGRSGFTGPLVLVTAAVALGCVFGLSRGGEFSQIADTARALLLVPLVFCIVYRAFAGRLPQLVAVVAVGAAVASVVELAASVAGWHLLLVDERSSVITGADTTKVSRLAAPVLPLWGPLLILLVSGAFPTRPRWRFLLLVVPGLVHEALSFNRSTWMPLLAGVALVAIARFGLRGVVRRLIVAAAVGTLALGAASAGVFGATGEALAERVTSVVTGEALAEDSLADRTRENTAALDTLRENPVLGTGVGVSYGGEIVSYDAVHDRTVVDVRPWIHNQYLRMWLWFGAFGLLAVGLLMVRVAAVVVHSWRRRAPATAPIVALGLGLACMALQSIFQTTLIDRPCLLTVALLLAMLGLAVSWRPPAPEQGARTPVMADGIMTR
jgi:O-antigen ligase